MRSTAEHTQDMQESQKWNGNCAKEIWGLLRFRMDLHSDSPKEVSGESLTPQLTNMVKS